MMMVKVIQNITSWLRIITEQVLRCQKQDLV